MNKYEVGNIINVCVTAVEPYGAFVSVGDGYSGLIHISEITGKYINDINNYIKVGDMLNAKIIDVDNNTKHLKLSLKNVRRSLKETDLGFFLLKDLLPIWMKEKLNQIEKNK